MKMRKVLSVLMAGALLCGALTSCSGGGDTKQSNKITLWTSGEDYKNENYLTGLQSQFPEYEFVMEYMNSSTIAAKIMAEGEKSTCDIVLSNEYGYLEMCKEYLAELDFVNFDQFLPEIVPEHKRYSPEVKNGGCIVVNLDVLAKEGLDKPKSYDDLLDPKYEGLISMPSPASSGTGYMFLRQLTNEWGEDKTFAYFAELNKNILQYTSSGSGPINALVQGEVAIGLGMTSQAVVEINEGAPLEIIFFEEGSPYSMYGYALLASSAQRKGIQEVFDYLTTELCKDNHEKYFPDQIFADYKAEIDGFPKDIHYGDMSNDTLDEKERLVAKWEFS